MIDQRKIGTAVVRFIFCPYRTAASRVLLPLLSLAVLVLSGCVTDSDLDTW